MATIERKDLFDSAFLLENFLTEEECNEFIRQSEEKGYEEAKVSFPEGQVMAKGIRNNDRVVYKDYELAENLFERAKPYLPEIIKGDEISRFNEMVRYYRYTPGQRFKRHKDGSYQASEDEESRLTFLVYLNDDCEGGETTIQEDVKSDNGARYYFGHNIKPETGTALIFPHPLWHEGSPVISGCKYVLRFDVMHKSREAA